MPLSWRDVILCAAAGLLIFAGIRLGLGLVLSGQIAFDVTLALFALAAVALLVRTRQGDT